MKIAGARVENKRLAPSLAIFMLGGAPKAHEFKPETDQLPDFRPAISLAAERGFRIQSLHSGIAHVMLAS
jgi:hypothetical protein